MGFGVNYKIHTFENRTVAIMKIDKSRIFVHLHLFFTNLQKILHDIASLNYVPACVLQLYIFSQ